MLSPENAPRVLFAHFIGDGFVRKADKFGERRVRPARSGRERRDEPGKRGPWVPIARSEVDGLRGPASRAAHPQEPTARLERAPDRRREQHRHALGLPLVPGGDETAGVFEDLRFRCAQYRGFLLGGFGAPRLHLAAIEPHGTDFAAGGGRGSSGRGKTRHGL